jgi:hypothetical protein
MPAVIGKYPTTWAGALVLCLLPACVPEGPSTADAGAPPKAAAVPAAPSPAKPGSSSSSTVAQVARPEAPRLTTPFEDNFNRAELGPDWNALGSAWKIQNGKLCARGARNKGVWLNRRIPASARIEFEAYAESSEGDLKIEAWGDGMSGATSQSYNNATSYLAILGGWHNTKHVLARLNEHGTDRLEIDVDPQSDDERMRAVAPGQPYHFKIERVDGKKVEWSVNNVVYFDFTDPEPLVGPGHEHFGFNEWDAPVCFDNLKVTPLL